VLGRSPLHGINTINSAPAWATVVAITYDKSTPCTYEVQVQDNGEPGTSDTVSITGVNP
jgi:hypothetical protein